MESRQPDPKTQKHSLECTVCGYGVARRVPPERCPMCQSRAAWTHSAWRPFSLRV
jgi:rubrerythrin